MNRIALIPILVALAACKPSPPEPETRKPALRVCADPNNLPFSNRRLEGFENKPAGLIGGTVAVVRRPSSR